MATTNDGGDERRRRRTTTTTATDDDDGGDDERGRFGILGRARVSGRSVESVERGGRYGAGAVRRESSFVQFLSPHPHRSVLPKVSLYHTPTPIQYVQYLQYNTYDTQREHCTRCGARVTRDEETLYVVVQVDGGKMCVP